VGKRRSKQEPLPEHLHLLLQEHIYTMRTVREAARELGIRLDYFYKLVPEQIAATKDAQGKWRIAPDDIEAYRTRRFGRKAAE
jgi:excisionase family DNA binding protein